MKKKHFIALADAIRTHNQEGVPFKQSQLDTLAAFCLSQNPNFKRGRWLGYIARTNGKNGGKVSK